MDRNDLARCLTAAASADAETVAAYHHEARKAFLVAAEALGLNFDDAHRLFCEEVGRIKSLGVAADLDGWAVYARASRVGSAYAINRKTRAALFALAPLNAAMAA